MCIHGVKMGRQTEVRAVRLFLPEGDSLGDEINVTVAKA
jgi:hypothetical protein